MTKNLTREELQPIWEMAVEFNAAISKFIGRDESGAITGAILILRGASETQEILDAIQVVENSWEGGAGEDGIPS